MASSNTLQPVPLPGSELKPMDRRKAALARRRQQEKFSTLGIEEAVSASRKASLSPMGSIGLISSGTAEEGMDQTIQKQFGSQQSIHQRPLHHSPSLTPFSEITLVPSRVSYNTPNEPSTTATHIPKAFDTGPNIIKESKDTTTNVPPVSIPMLDLKDQDHVLKDPALKLPSPFENDQIKEKQTMFSNVVQEQSSDLQPLQKAHSQMSIQRSNSSRLSIQSARDILVKGSPRPRIKRPSPFSSPRMDSVSQGKMQSASISPRNDADRQFSLSQHNVLAKTHIMSKNSSFNSIDLKQTDQLSQPIKESILTDTKKRLSLNSIQQVSKTFSEDILETLKQTERKIISWSDTEGFNNYPLLQYTPEQQSAILTLQSWWRGRTTRTFLTGCLIAKRLEQGGATIGELKYLSSDKYNKIGPQKRKSIKKKMYASAYKQHDRYIENDFRYKPDTRLDVWPRHLVSTLCDFLNSLEPQDTPYTINHQRYPYRHNSRTMASLYNSHMKQQQPPFSFVLEKRALRQLMLSRKEREQLARRLRHQESTE